MKRKCQNMKIACFYILYIQPPSMEAQRANVALMSFLRLFTETITPEGKNKFFFKIS